MEGSLDAIDRGILFLLQQDARNTTALEMAEQLDVAPSTVRNRIKQLEENTVLQGYYPFINYQKTAFPHLTVFIVTAPPTERTDRVHDLLAVQGVIEVREMVSGQKNLHVEAVAQSRAEITELTDAIHELGVRIERTEILKQRQKRPLADFGNAVDPSSHEEENGTPS